MTDDAQTSDGVDAATQRTAVRQRYADAATDSCGCCGDASTDEPERTARDIGYSEDDLSAVEPGANLGLGCGNPTAIASLEEGERVLDLGSGGGFDCFLAARQVGSAGSVVGVDMTPEMVERARENAANNDAGNVEFRLGEIEHLPVADESVDVVLSNCVVNLSPEKPQVFREAYRVLRPGGRLAISDLVLTADLPAEYQTDLDTIAGCVGGATTPPALEAMLADAGFSDVSVELDADGDDVDREFDADREPSDYVVSATIEAEKPTA
ncbi:arsenite methyltransferase [Halobacterium wangiae]|uniref:arsenite methyltransferase n=1 Tax=Halobacterium wangiae TaxID=2902623 RepID=UPI001E3465C0|nr:arsenite methyltransferase [Halobacterium wangiae]